MSKRGPSPKPTNLKILEGNPGRRPIDGDEPQPDAGAVCPDWLSESARSEWARLSPVLERCGILTAADRDVLAAYCDALANYVRATREIEALPSLIEDGPHGRKIAPVVSAQRNYAELVVKFGGRLGLSPSDRVGIKVSDKPKGGKWSDKITG